MVRWQAMDFRRIPENRRPNRWLICPPGYSNQAPDEAPPVFGTGVTTLRDGWRALVLQQPRIDVTYDEADAMELVQRTRILRFADDISVAYIGLGRGRSTIALFSRSRVGYSDMGTNRCRLQDWMNLLKSVVPVAISDAAKS